jgi:hypothetical protein
MEKAPKDKKMMIYVMEEGNRGHLGREIVFQASKMYPDLEVRRIDWMYASNSIFNFQALQLPAVLAVPVDQNTLNWYNSNTLLKKLIN